MEENKVEVLDPILPDMDNEGSEAPMKEYEKLLIAERNRVLNQKALNLIKLGCFEQKEEETFDFSDYTKIEGKKYSGVYTLYQNDSTGQLVFVCPLVEDNKNDENERLDLAPYAYNCIFIEEMDDETYQTVLKAGDKNIGNALPVFYILLNVFYWIVVALTVFFLFYSIVNGLILKDSIFNILQNYFLIYGSLVTSSIVGGILMFLMNIKYRDYKNNK